MPLLSGAFARRLTAAATATAALVVPTMATAPAHAAGTVKSAVSLTGPAIGWYGSTATYTGTAWRYGTTTKLVNATIWLQRKAHGTANPWSNAVSTKTDSSGRFSFSVVLATRYDYRAYYGGSPTYTANVSAVLYTATQQKVVARYLKDANWQLGTLEGKASVYPRPPKGTRVWLQRLRSDGQWGNYISGVASGTSNDVVIRGNVPGSVGTYRFYVPVVGVYSQGWSSSIKFAHYKWRGAFRKSILGYGGTTSPWHYVYSSTQSPTRSELELGAGKGGTSWVDVNTSGCKRIAMGAINYTNEYTPSREYLGLIIGGKWSPQAYDVAAGGTRETEVPFSSQSKVRVQVTDIGATDGAPLAYYVLFVLCSN